VVDVLGWTGFFTFATIAGFLGVIWIKVLPPLFETRESDHVRMN
jgi:hypothetical protein